jgi:hypothetical protein
MALALRAAYPLCKTAFLPFCPHVRVGQTHNIRFAHGASFRQASKQKWPKRFAGHTDSSIRKVLEFFMDWNTQNRSRGRLSTIQKNSSYANYSCGLKGRNSGGQPNDSSWSAVKRMSDLSPGTDYLV